MERSPAPGAAVDRLSDRSGAAGGAARAACACAAPRRSRGGRSTRPAAETSTPAARAEGAAVRELALTDRGVLAPEDVDVYEDVADPRRGVALGDRSAARSEPASAASSVVVRAARARARPACASSRRGRGQDAHRRRALHLRCRLAERAALGALGQRRDDRGPAAGGVDGAVGRAPGRRRELDDRDADAGDDRSRHRGRLRRGGRLLARRRAPAGRARGARRRSGHAAVPGHRDARRWSSRSWAARADKLGAFKRWGSPSWRAGTLALR